jgi:hypothetical protein
MTIEQHFMWMLILEFGIFFIGIGLIVWQQRKQTQLIESIVYNPDYASAVFANGVFGIMDQVANDKEKAEVFFSFVNACGVNAFAAVREHFSKNPLGDKPIKTGSKLLDGFINIPQIKQAVANKFQQAVENGVANKVEGVVEGWG